jgi:hypothetical protein
MREIGPRMCFVLLPISFHAFVALALMSFHLNITKFHDYSEQESIRILYLPVMMI